MVAETSDARRVDLALHSIASIVAELPSLDADWLTLSDDERLSWGLTWGNEMAKLRQLTEAERAGSLDCVRSHRVRLLAGEVVRALPVIDRLDLRRPTDQILAAGQVRA